MTSQSLPTLSFSAHVLIKPEGSDTLPRSHPSQNPDTKRWQLRFDIHLGDGPPPCTLGEAGDVYFSKRTKVFVRMATAWQLWNLKKPVQWPGPEHANTASHYLVHRSDRGVYWGQRNTARRAAAWAPSVFQLEQATIQHWLKKFQTRSSDDSQDIMAMAMRLGVAVAQPSAEFAEEEDDVDEGELHPAAERVEEDQEDELSARLVSNSNPMY